MSLGRNGGRKDFELFLRENPIARAVIAILIHLVVPANSPGPYRAPEKVAVRKTIVSVRGAGSVVLFGVALFVGTRKKEHEKEEQPG